MQRRRHYYMTVYKQIMTRKQYKLQTWITHCKYEEHLSSTVRSLHTQVCRTFKTIRTTWSREIQIWRMFTVNIRVPHRVTLQVNRITTPSPSEHTRSRRLTNSHSHRYHYCPVKVTIYLLSSPSLYIFLIQSVCLSTVLLFLFRSVLPLSPWFNINHKRQGSKLQSKWFGWMK